MDLLPPLSLGQWLKQQRQAHDWTQEDLAIQTNCSVGTIRRFEYENGHPSKQTAQLLATCLAIPAADRAAFVRWARSIPGMAPPPSVLNSACPASLAPFAARRPALPLPATPLIGRDEELAQLQALLDRLPDRFTLLTGGRRDWPVRQQTLRGTLDWSFQLLDPAEQQLFAQLAVFVGGFTVAAAAAVCAGEPGTPAPMLDRLEALVEKSLLRQGTGIAAEPRFGMLETIREYAEAQLQAEGDPDSLRERHAVYFLQWVTALPARELDLDTQMHYASLERANLHALAAWATRQGRADIITWLGLVLWQSGMGVHLEAANVAGWNPAP